MTFKWDLLSFSDVIEFLTSAYFRLINRSSDNVCIWPMSLIEICLNSRRFHCLRSIVCIVVVVKVSTERQLIWMTMWTKPIVTWFRVHFGTYFCVVSPWTSVHKATKLLWTNKRYTNSRLLVVAKVSERVSVSHVFLNVCKWNWNACSFRSPNIKYKDVFICIQVEIKHGIEVK